MNRPLPHARRVARAVAADMPLYAGFTVSFVFAAAAVFGLLG